MVTHYPAKFSGYMHCASGDIMVLVCYVILQDLECKSHMIYGKEPLNVSQHPARFSGHWQF